MTYRFGTALALFAVAVAVACVDMSAPKGAASISGLLLPSPSVVVGDVMRDSLGTPTPLHIVAFDANGAPVADADAKFFITDTGRTAHIDASNSLFGDKFGTIHVIGQIGSLQTPSIAIPVTVAPTKITATAATIDTLKVPITGDSATSFASTPLGVTVRGANDSTAQGFIVRYVLTKAPATISGSTAQAVYLADDFGKFGVALPDTSDGSGASRKLVVNSKFLADPVLQAGTKTDSAVVTATLTYKGVAVAGSPIRFVVPIRITVNAK